MATTMQLQRAWRGPVLFSYGFRPFFLGASVLAATLVGLWVPWFLGLIAVPSALPPVAWHVHELLFGYVIAVIAGFLLTAVPNWTGRLPVVGWPLACLFALWCAGRLAMAFSAGFDPLVLAAISLTFPLALAAVLGREIVAGRSWRNLKVLAALAILTVAQAWFHVEIWRYDRPVISDRMAIAAAIMLIMIVGGRIVPSFTGNWLRRGRPGRMPAPFDRLDVATMIVAGAALVAWMVAGVVDRLALPAGMLAIAAGIAQFWRLMRWAGDRTLPEPLVAVLHLAFAFVPFGFVLTGIGLALDDAAWRSAGVHAWTTGAIGLMTLAVMTRATRGHTGRPLAAPWSTTLIYALAVMAAFLRMAAALHLEKTAVLLSMSGLCWTAAFAGFGLAYGPMLARDKV
jgi:uncharacterized protein involved in response to NO